MTRRALILAHRGFHQHERENTLAALRASRSAAADGVEFDVRSLRDGTLVLHHDPSFWRRGRRHRLRESLRRETPVWVPRLVDAMRWLRTWPRAWIDVEVKERGLEAAVVAVAAGPRVVYTSFRADVVKRIRALRPTAATGWIRERARLADVEDARLMGCEVLVVHRGALREPLVRRARENGLDVWAWGINTARGYRRAGQLGIAAVITDRPDRLPSAPQGRRGRR